MTTWKKPTFLEICMNAEIGAYQEDTGDEREMPLVKDPLPADEARATEPATGPRWLARSHVA